MQCSNPRHYAYYHKVIPNNIYKSRKEGNSGLKGKGGGKKELVRNTINKDSLMAYLSFITNLIWK